MFFFSGCVDCIPGTITVYNFVLDDSDFLTFSCQHECQAHEAVSLSESTPVNVQGRLRKHSSFWTGDLEASEFVRDIVRYGYRIPFLATPAPVFCYNHLSALQNEQFVFEAIDKVVTGVVSYLSLSAHLYVAPYRLSKTVKGSIDWQSICAILTSTSQSRSLNMNV